MAGVGLLATLTVLLGVVVPSVPEPPPGALSSAIAFSDAAAAGREVYLREGCASCHTQLVRAVVADAGLGPVTLSDTNQVPGVRRYGPDLAHIGSRVEDTAALGNALTGGLAGHPRYGGLSDRDLSDLVAYLAESR
jgi:cytochrome c oxidase cbb3-type subunit II